MKEILRNKSICYYKRPTITIYNLLSIHRFPTKDFFKNLIGENIPLIERTLTIDLSLVEPTETNLPAHIRHLVQLFSSCLALCWEGQLVCPKHQPHSPPGVQPPHPHQSAVSGLPRLDAAGCCGSSTLEFCFPQNDHLYSYVGVLPLPGFQWQMTFFLRGSPTKNVRILGDCCWVGFPSRVQLMRSSKFIFHNGDHA